MSGLKKHKDLTNIHRVHCFEYADAATREAVTTWVPADIGKVARDIDTNCFFVLVDDAGPTWEELTNKTVPPDLDVKVSVSSNDTTAGFLDDKIVATEGTNSANILETYQVNDGADEDLELRIDQTKIEITESQITDLSHTVDTFAKVELDGALQSTGAPTLDFDGSDFAIPESPADSFDITVKDSGIDHDATTNYVANEHIDWTAVSAGTIDPSNYVDNNDDEKVKVSVNDTIPGYLLDKIIAGSTKVSITEINDASDEDLSIDIVEANINHDALLNFVANEHIDWTAASAGTIDPTNYVDLNDKVGVDASDTAQYLEDQICAGPNITINKTGAVGSRCLEIEATSTIIVTEDCPAVQVRRTTQQVFTGAFVDVTFDVTDVENFPASLEHDNTNTDRILIHETGLYTVNYHGQTDVNVSGMFEYRVRLNDSVVIDGSDSFRDDGGDTFPHSIEFLCECTAGDFLTLQIKSTGGGEYEPPITLQVTKCSGAKGADGATGATGAGANIIVQKDDVTVGTVTSTLNFEGPGVFSAVDEGANKTTVTIQGGGSGDPSYASLYMEDNATATTNAGTVKKVSGTTTPGTLLDFTHTNNRLTYTGTETQPFLITGQLSSITQSNDENVTVHIYKNGVKVAAKIGNRVSSSDDKIGAAPVSAIVSLATNDYVELWVHQETTNENVTVKHLNLTATSIGSAGADGAQGATGATGATGAGSNVLIADEGTNIANTPHSRLNFVGSGVSATDAGGGTTDITISGGGVFGGGYEYAESETETSTTSATYVDKLSHTTAALTSGDYRIGFTWESDVDTNSVVSDFKVLVGATVIAEPSMESDGDWLSFSGFRQLNLSGAQTIKIQYKSGNGVAAVEMRRARIEIWRVS